MVDTVGMKSLNTQSQWAFGNAKTVSALLWMQLAWLAFSQQLAKDSTSLNVWVVQVGDVGTLGESL